MSKERDQENVKYGSRWLIFISHLDKYAINFVVHVRFHRHSACMLGQTWV